MAADSGAVPSGETPAGHPDSDQLALLAMQADTEPGVAKHVDQCDACQRDIAVIFSLLDADAPEVVGEVGASAPRAPVTPEELAMPSAAQSAMRDTADGLDTPEPPPLTDKEARKRAEKVLSAQRPSGQGRQTLYLVLLVVAAMLVVGLLALR